MCLANFTMRVMLTFSGDVTALSQWMARRPEVKRVLWPRLLGRSLYR